MAARPVRGNLVWRPSLWAFLLLNLLDLASTWIATSQGMKEANLLPATLLAAGGPGAVLLFKIAAVLSVLAMVTLLGQRYPALWRGLKFSNVLLAIIVLSNSVQILLGA